MLLCRYVVTLLCHYCEIGLTRGQYQYYELTSTQNTNYIGPQPSVQSVNF